MTIVDCTLLAEVDIISAGVVGLIALIVFVFAILSAKDWHWVNVVFLILTLISSITAIIGMTFAYHHRIEGLRAYDREFKAAEKAEKDVAMIISGDPTQSQYGKDSLRYRSNQLALALTGRGLVWRNGKVGVDGDNRTFTRPKERTPEQIAKTPFVEAIVYAFADNRGFPNRYIGSMRISAETGTEFTLEPVDLADKDRFDDPSTTWTLYEKMPQDRHGIFKEELRSNVSKRLEENGEPTDPVGKQRSAFVKRMNDQSKDFDFATFVEILKRDYLPAERLGFDPSSLEYEQLIDQFAFDNQPISKIEAYIKATPGRIVTNFEPKEEQKVIKFTFTADADIAIKTDGVGSVELLGVYNSGGEAVIPNLMENPEGVTFNVNDVVYIDELSASDFQQTYAGKVKKDDTLFVRRLQDFPLLFKDRKIRVARINEEIIIAEATAEKTRTALKDAEAQDAALSDLRDKNSEDNDRFKKDLEILGQANDTLKQRSTELAQQIAQRKEKVESLYEQIKAQALDRLRAAVSVSN